MAHFKTDTLHLAFEEISLEHIHQYSEEHPESEGLVVAHQAMLVAQMMIIKDLLERIETLEAVQGIRLKDDIDQGLDSN